jgi:hypothetical protein
MKDVIRNKIIIKEMIKNERILEFLKKFIFFNSGQNYNFWLELSSMMMITISNI